MKAIRTSILPLAAATTLSAFSSTLHAAGLTSSDLASNDTFGNSVSQLGNIGLVGAREDNIGANADQGSAYLFRNLDTATGAITQNVKLTASDGAASDFLGTSVSLSGSIGLLGASGDDIGAKLSQGSAYLFRDLETATGTITQNAKLTASDGADDDFLGVSISLSGSIGLIGASGDNTGANSDQGSAYVFRDLDTATGTATENAKLTASDGATNDYFGISVSLSSTIGLVGSVRSDIGANTDQGAAYVYRDLNTATGTITQNAKLTASDGAFNDQFGNSVSLSGSSALVGAVGDDIGANNEQGSAHLFRNLNTATSTKTEDVKLIASDGATGDTFGTSVSLSGSAGIVGASGDDGAYTNQGSAYLFLNLDMATGTITQNVKLTASDAATPTFSFEGLGRSVSLDGDQFVIGAPGKNAFRGKAYTSSLASFTTLDAGSTSKTISQISFVSQEDWIVGQTTDVNTVTLSTGDSGNVTASGKAVYIGRNAGSDNNRLVVAGSVTATQVIVGPTSGGTGNHLEITATGSLTATVIINTGSVLSAGGPIIGNVTNNGTVRVTGGAALQVTGTFTNNGVLDLITGSNTLPSGFVNNGIVLDSKSVKVTSVAINGSDFVLTLQGYAGHGYQLQRNDDLAGQWANVGSVQNGNGLPLTFTDTGGVSGPAGFYRVLIYP